MADIGSSLSSNTSKDKTTIVAKKSSKTNEKQGKKVSGKDDKKKVSVGKSPASSCDIAVETVFDWPVSEFPQSRIDTNVVEKRTSEASSDEPNMKDLMNMTVNIQSEHNSQKKSMNTLQYMVNEMFYEP